MKPTIFYLACLFTLALLVAGCSSATESKSTPTSATQAVAQAAGASPSPSATVTISTPSIVTVGASATIVPSATKTKVPSKTPKPSATSVPSNTARPSSTPKYAPVVKAANFVLTIDNPYLPLTPGATFDYTGTRDTSKLLDQVVVTSKTRKLMGVTCIEVDETLLVEDKLARKTASWYAQDIQGNVWLFGEEIRQFNTAGKVTSTAGTWLAGSKGALPGILMQANPVADQNYRQDYSKGRAEDMAQVLGLNESVSGPSGSYTGVLEIKEWSALKPKLLENKWYAKGIGLIAAKVVQGGNQELQLSEVKK